MRYLVAFLCVSLFPHTSSPSSQNTKLDGQLDVTKEQRLENAKLAMRLLRAFTIEELGSKKTPTIYMINPASGIPFTFPIFSSYDMDLSEKLSEKAGISSQRMFSVLVQIIYRLLQFHIQRLFKIDPSEPFIFSPDEYSRMQWEDSHQDWFAILLSAIMPGAIAKVFIEDVPIEVNHIYAKPFQFLKNNDNLFGYSTRKDGILNNLVLRCDTAAPTVSVCSPPARFLGKELTPGQAIILSIGLERSYPHCKKILNQLLQGVTFAFDLNHAELEVTVKPTKDIPSVEESRHLLKELFRAPIEAPIMIPEDIESALQNRAVPKASCYHPNIMPFSSPKLYERMLTLIVAGGILTVLEVRPDGNINYVMNLLEYWLKLYLPDSSIKIFTGVNDAPERNVCTYNPKSSTMWIYRGVLNGATVGFLLELGKPVMLNHIQMNAFVQAVFPFSFVPPAMEQADTPAEQILKAISKKLEEPMNVVKVETTIMPLIPMSKTEEDDLIALEQVSKFALHPYAFRGTAKNIMKRLQKNASIASLTFPGAYHTILFSLGSPGNTYHVIFPPLYPMPSGKIFAVNLKTGQIIRNKMPVMLLTTNTQGEKVDCCFMWFDSKFNTGTQSLTKIDKIFEVISP